MLTNNHLQSSYEDLVSTTQIQLKVKPNLKGAKEDGVVISVEEKC